MTVLSLFDVHIVIVRQQFQIHNFSVFRYWSVVFVLSHFSLHMIFFFKTNIPLLHKRNWTNVEKFPIQQQRNRTWLLDQYWFSTPVPPHTYMPTHTHTHTHIYKHWVNQTFSATAWNLWLLLLAFQVSCFL